MVKIRSAVFVIVVNIMFSIVSAKPGDYSCITIEDAVERLECYDKKEKIKQATETKSTEKAATSLLRSRIDSEKKIFNIGEFTIIPHRPTYIMPLTYVSSLHDEPLSEAYGDKADQIQNYEAKYQLSFKVPLWQNIADKDMTLWFGYTQLSLWQLYNTQVSSPFRETNYEPEIALAFDTDFKLWGMTNTFILLGLNHQSNGQSDPLSRSWNRLYASFVFERNNLVMFFKPWYRLPADKNHDDNPGIDEYLGYGELSLYYKQKKRVTGLKLWNNLRATDNRTSLQLDWNFPIGSGFKGYIQYFNGYGETLIDYNFRSKRFGLGIMLTDWF
ncbi:MAG: phospholipase A [Cycloclasticus sp.]|nr:phospholipase A [Cycloclasticus sp.]